jgi:hypothetical protein
MKKRNSISEQFAVRILTMLESPAYRALSLSAHRVLSRVEVELAHHGGNDNGKLPVTYDDFVQYGVHRHAVAPAIREACALGFLEVTEVGQAGNADFRKPNKFRLTYAYARGAKPTHDWRHIETIEQAVAVARAARKGGAKKQKTSAGKRQVSVPDSITENPIPQCRIPSLQVIVRNPSLLSISRGGGRSPDSSDERVDPSDLSNLKRSGGSL